MRSSVPFDKNFRPQGIILGQILVLTDNGLQPENINFGIFFHKPGVLCGIIDQGEITPALPKEVVCPGSLISIKRTFTPRSCKDKAEQIPMIPPPKIVTSRVFITIFLN